MSGNIRLYNTSGYVELQAPSSASAQVLELPTDSIQPGLVHLHTETFSAKSTVSISDVFSSTYDNYRLVLTHSGGNEDVNFRLQSSGTPSTTNYSDQTVAGDGASATAGRVTRGSVNLGINTNPGISDFAIHAPFLTQVTALVGFGGNAYNGSHIRMITGIHSIASSYDGFTLTPGGAGTISGIAHIYGYRNS